MPASSDPAPVTSEASITLAGDLHARPAGQLSVAAAGFASSVRLSVSSRDSDVDAKSVLAVMQLGASSGQRVTVRAIGPDAPDAVDAVIAILAAATAVE
ncbi:MAG TPA: HPr family phosphocarrier protein [Trebonia sp.]